MTTQAKFGIATSVLSIIGVIMGLTLRFSERFAALDTRMAKLESAIKAINVNTPDDKYRELIKELMAEAQQALPDAAKKADAGHHFGSVGNASYPADAGASASSPAMVKPQ